MTPIPLKKEAAFLSTGKAFLYDKKSICISFTSLLLLLICYFTFYKTADLDYFPNEKIAQTSFFNDGVDAGNSVLNHTFKNDSAAGIQFTLHDGFSYPYSGIEISFKDRKGLNISKYNRVKIQVASQQLKYLTCFLIVKDKNVIDTLSRLTNRRLTLELPVDGTLQNLELKISDFSTPDWWFTKINQPKSDFHVPDMDHLVSVIVSTGVSPRLNQLSGITLYRIQFHRDTTDIIMLMGCIQFMIMASLFLLLFRKRPRTDQAATIDIYYKPIQLDEKPDSGYTFLDYMQHHYDDSELCLKKISKSTGVNQRTISDTIFEKFNCNFKTYINQIRIIEAKRLLQDSDLNISEVAYKVGFNSPTSFNRVFKTITNSTPSEYIQTIKNQ